MTTVTLDPATRLEGHLKVKVESAGGRVTSAQSGGLLYRGFENLLINKDPRDAAHITQRICGVCPTSHAMAAVKAMEVAAGMAVTPNGSLIRNLILGADFLHSHILHFYHLTAPDFVRGPDMPPWTPSYDVDMRFNDAENQRLVGNYVAALAFRRKAHEMGAILGGRLPHTVAYEFGGVTTVPTAGDLSRFRAYLDEIIGIVDNTLLPDVEFLAQRYADYYEIGRRYGNLAAFGVFDQNADGSSKLLGRGRVELGGSTVLPIDLGAIVERVEHSWYTSDSGGLNAADGVTRPSSTKADAYSWLKAPRYGGVAYEVGPLARMWVNNDYRRGISVMDRHHARALEASKIGHAMREWLDQVDVGAPSFTPGGLPKSGAGVGLTEAPRGALGHWLRLREGKVESYQILTPTCWNCSPRDNVNLPGPLEKALENTPLSDTTRPSEVMRVIHSFDPCLSCAVH